MSFMISAPGLQHHVTIHAALAVGAGAQSRALASSHATDLVSPGPPLRSRF